MRLLELSPARLLGALVVRQMSREGREARVVGEKEEGQKKEGEHMGITTGAEAFRLPGENGK